MQELQQIRKGGESVRERKTLKDEFEKFGSRNGRLHSKFRRMNGETWPDHLGEDKVKKPWAIKNRRTYKIKKKKEKEKGRSEEE